MLHQIKAPQFYTDFGLQTHVLLHLPVNGKIKGLFKAFESFSSTFQACANPGSRGDEHFINHSDLHVHVYGLYTCHCFM